MRVVGLVLAALVRAVPQNASVQLWLQTSRVIVPVEDGPTRAFLATLVSVMARRERTVRRSRSQNEKGAVSALRDKLISTNGIGVGSANHAVIDYRFTIDDGSRFEQEITKSHFVFRPGSSQSDISVMYLGAQR